MEEYAVNTGTDSDLIFYWELSESKNLEQTSLKSTNFLFLSKAKFQFSEML